MTEQPRSEEGTEPRVMSKTPVSPSGEIGLPEIRDRIIRLARIWDEQSVEPPEDFADALLADLGVRYAGMLYEDSGEFHQYDPECCPARPEDDLPACVQVYVFGGSLEGPEAG